LQLTQFTQDKYNKQLGKIYTNCGLIRVLIKGVDELEIGNMVIFSDKSPSNLTLRRALDTTKLVVTSQQRHETKDTTCTAI
jgi:hypothetical protein